MDVNDLLTALNGVLDLGDTLDNNGIGISAMTNWQHTTRELCKMELGSFLLYVGAGGGFFNDGQAGLVNLLLSDKYGQIPSWQMKSVADELDMPIAANNATFAAFKNGDDALSQQNGVPTKQLTDLLISLYESFGGLMVAFNENVLSRVRCDTYVNGLKARQGSGSFSSSLTTKPTVTKPAAAKSTVGANIDVSSYIPAGVTLTDNQKEYLSAIVDLINKYGPVDSSTVAMHMHKSTSAVSSAVSTLIKKGILDKNDDAKIVIAEKKEATTKRSTGSVTKKTASKKSTEHTSSNVATTKKTVPAKDVLITQKFKGIHHISDKPETICPFGTWTIDVPAGFSYTMDPDFACSSMLGQKYPLQIQTTDDCDFSSSYESSFGLTIYPSNVVWVDIEDGGGDLRSSYSQEVLRGLEQNGFHHYTVLLHNSDVLVQYDNSNRDSECITIQFQIICSGLNEGSIGQIDVHGPKMKELEKKALEMLASVGKVHQEYGSDQYKPFAVSEKATLNFSSGKTLKLSPSVSVPIPDGFHATDDQSKTGGRSFIIVPEKYAFSSDPMKATVGISGAVGQINLPDEYLFGQAFSQLRNKLPSGIFINNSTVYYTRISKRCAAFMQENYEETDGTWALYRIMLLAGNEGFILTMRVNFGKTNVSFQAASIDARGIVCHWLSHIRLQGDSSERIPIATPQVPDIFYEHYTLITSGTYTTHRDADFIGQPIRMLMEKCGNTAEKAYSQMEISKDTYTLNTEATQLATVFRLVDNLFDSHKDTEAMIRLGMFTDVKMFHLLRSLAWTVCSKADHDGRSLESFNFDELTEIAETLDKNPLNYCADSYCAGLCSHYDWHVFYVPEKYIKSKNKSTPDLRGLCGKENRGGNRITIIDPIFNATDRGNDIISRNEETLESLEALRKNLEELLPVMQTIYDGFMQDRDRTKKLSGPLAEALNAWCALAIAAKEPFYSEEAADTPEADAALEKPLERPSGEPQDVKNQSVKKPTAGTVKSTAKSSAKASPKNATKPASKASPKPVSEKKPMNDSIRKLELSGKTTIEKNKYLCDSDTRPLEIPEGIVTIEQSAFSMAKMASVKLPKTLKKIEGFAFNSCPNLISVEIQEGLEEIGFNSFGQCPKLTTVKLPSTIRIIDRNAFVEEISTDPTSKITLHIPGEAARRVEKNNKYRGIAAVIAAGFIIDGTWYPTLERFVEKVEAEEKARIERERAEQRARAERERQEKERREAEARKEQQKNALLKQIRDLEAERDAAKGLFAGMKRNKIQKQIDELKGRLRRL